MGVSPDLTVWVRPSVARPDAGLAGEGRAIELAGAPVEGVDGLAEPETVVWGAEREGVGVRKATVVATGGLVSTGVRA